jgi:hypothetical protein
VPRGRSFAHHRASTYYLIDVPNGLDLNLKPLILDSLPELSNNFGGRFLIVILTGCPDHLLRLVRLAFFEMRAGSPRERESLRRYADPGHSLRRGRSPEMSTRTNGYAATTRRATKRGVQGRHRQRSAAADARPVTAGKGKAKIVAAGVIGTTALAIPLGVHWGASGAIATPRGTAHLTADQVLRANGTQFRGYTTGRPPPSAPRGGRRAARDHW